MATMPATPPVPVVRLVDALRVLPVPCPVQTGATSVAMLDLIVAGWVSQAVGGGCRVGCGRRPRVRAPAPR